jgi:hypothetical protein
MMGWEQHKKFVRVLSFIVSMSPLPFRLAKSL